MNRVFPAVLLAIPLALSAQVYKTVDENGDTIFTDTPPASGPVEKVQLGTINSTPPPPQITRPKPAVKEEKVELSVEIVSPPPDTTIAIGYAGNFSVEARVTPAMAHGTYAQLLIDGTAIGEPQALTSWSLNNIFRGSHKLTVVITDTSGKQLGASPPITVNVMRAGLGH